MNTRFILLLFHLFIILFYIKVNANNDQSLILKLDSIPGQVELDKYWKYKMGDNTSWANFNFDDNDWDTLQTKLNLEEIPEGTFEGIGWFRLHIQIDSSLRNTVHAFTINQQGASEIYLNGELIESFGKIIPDENKEELFNPSYIPTLIKFGDSTSYVLAVRYSNQNALKNYKIYNKETAGFTISLQKPNDAIQHVSVMGYVRNVFLAILTVFAVIAVLHLLLYLFYRRQKSNLYFFLFMVSITMMWLIVLFNFSSRYDPGLMMKLLFYFRVFVVLAFPFLSIFIYSIFYSRFPKISKVVMAMIPVLIILVIFQNSWISKIISAINLIILIDIIRNIIRAMIKKKKGSWIIGTGFIFFILFFLIIAFLGLTANKDIIASPGSTMGIIILSTFLPGIISIPSSMSIYLARDFASTSRNLEKQLENVKILSAKTLEQEKEKQRILENQKEKLEIMVDERTRELAFEKEKTEELLLNTLPLKVVNELKLNGKSEPESFDNVTVYFSDIVGFTKISSLLEPKTLINELNEIFTAFDDIITSNNCERIKTIGDAYLAVSGMPAKDEHHAQNMINAAIQIKQYIDKRNNLSDIRWQIRIGLHSGKVVGGIVGVRKYIYDVFGDTINTASRMESNSEPMRINVSETTYRILKNEYLFIERDPIQVKGKGKMKMYFLEDV